MQSDKVIYRVRPKDDKHPVLLPIGEKAQFRLEKDKMLLRVEDLDDKEREYIVLSMTRAEKPARRNNRSWCRSLVVDHCAAGATVRSSCLQPGKKDCDVRAPGCALRNRLFFLIFVL